MVPGAHSRQSPDPGEKWPTEHGTGLVVVTLYTTVTFEVLLLAGVLLALAPSAIFREDADTELTFAEAPAALSLNGVLDARAPGGGPMLTASTCQYTENKRLNTLRIHRKGLPCHPRKQARESQRSMLAPSCTNDTADTHGTHDGTAGTDNHSAPYCRRWRRAVSTKVAHRTRSRAPFSPAT